MKCEKVKELFSAYIENELSAREREAFEQHVHECTHCREDLSKFKASLMLVENLREIDLPVTFHARTMSLLEREKYARPKKVSWFRLDWQHVFTVKVPAKAIASAFAALLLFAFIMHITPAGSFISGHLFPSAKTTTESLSGKDPDWAPPAPMPYIDESIQANNTVMVKPIGIGSDTSSYTLYIKADKDQSKYIDIYKSTSNGFTWLYKLNGNSARDVEVSRNTVYKVVQHSEKESVISYVFLPVKFDKYAERKLLSISIQNSSVYSILRKISETYGVAIIASGDLSKKIPSFISKQGSPEDAIYQCVALSGMSWKKTSIPSVYVVGSF